MLVEDRRNGIEPVAKFGEAFLELDGLGFHHGMRCRG